jgi:uncharacterized protein YdeI (YjbR/CyaY-like superfamily)
VFAIAPPLAAEAGERMAAVIPPAVRSFKTEAAFNAWLRVNPARATEVWVRIFKRHTGIQTVTTAQALDVALCWGWIDGIRQRFDAESFLQRYSPRRTRSLWSQINCANVDRLTRAGRMQPAGLRQVEAARADGRWAAAYAPLRATTAATVPDDLRAAIDANARARKMFDTLGRANLFALAFRTNQMKTPAGRARKIAALVAMLARGEAIVPEKRRPAPPQRVLFTGRRSR